MDWLGLAARHGYSVAAAILFLGSVGLPMPLSVVLLTAGAAAHTGSLSLVHLIFYAWIAAVLGDTIMYFGGRMTGWWLLAGICRLSMNPETCIFGSAKQFHKRGPRTLLFAKFIPGLATVAAPLAGSLYMRLSRFWRLDAFGVLCYVTVWSTAGYLCSRFIRELIGYIERVGHVTAGMISLLIVAYLLYLAYNWIRDRRFVHIERVTADELWERMQAPHPDRIMVIADVRSHGYYDPGMQRIKNSIRVEPTRLKEELEALREFMAPECEIYLYCSCAGDATSVRVAHALEQENCRTKVIQGGLRAWMKAGGALEPVPAGDVEHLPRFD